MADYRCIVDIDEIKAYLKGAHEIAFDFETAPCNKYRNEQYGALDPHKSDIAGISLSVNEGSAIYIPLGHRNYKNGDVSGIMDLLKDLVFENPDVTKIAHNLSFEAMFLYKNGIVLKAPVYDTLAAAQLTLKSDKEFRNLSHSGLKTLAKELLGVDLPEFSNVTGGRHFDELDPEDNRTIDYACSDSGCALRLYHLFNGWFQRFMPAHEYIVREIESPAAVFVGMMKYNGIMADKVLMYRKQFEAEEKLAELKGKLWAMAGRVINIGANAQTADFKKFLYAEQGLPVLKATERFKEALDDEALILLREWCTLNKPELAEFINTVQEYRKWSKLKSTYIDGILKYINPVTDGIHADFFPLGTETGRFASSRPNLQNLPRKGSDPIGIRNFFIAREGHVFLDFDFSQIELRVGAYYCRDDSMLDTYRKGGDIHAQTTSVIYNIPLHEAADKNVKDYKERRSIAKNCNFGVFFGLFPKGLQRNLHIKAGLDTTLSECEGIIRNLKKGYPGLAKWQEETKQEARVKGYSETALGRRRYLKGIDSSDFGTRSYYERCALNTPIQGTAADILKLVLGRIVDGIKDCPYLKPILQVHDEIMFEVPEDKVMEAAAFVKACMEKTPFEGFDVPIVAEGSKGKRFGELREV